MPAFRTARWIEQAIASVLAQQDIALELIVVDDASDDGIADIVQRIDDPRVRLLRNETRRGIGYCHNRVIDAADSPYVAHVDADDFILPGALRAMVDALEASPTAGQAFCDFHPVDADGNTGEAEREAWLRRLSYERSFQKDIRRALLVHGMVANHLRTYRREVFDEVGRFDETLPWAVDLEMALRIAQRYDLIRVPRPLYAWRVHGAGTSDSLRAKELRFWWMRVRLCRALLREQRGSLLGRRAPAVYALLGLGLLHLIPRPRRTTALVLEAGPAPAAGAPPRSEPPRPADRVPPSASGRAPRDRSADARP